MWAWVPSERGSAHLMEGPFRRRYVVVDLLLLTTITLVIVVLGLTSAGPGGSSGGRRYLATLLPSAPGRVLPSGFLGLSLEYPALQAYAGDDPLAPNPIFEALIRQLAPGQAPELR